MPKIIDASTYSKSDPRADKARLIGAPEPGKKSEKKGRGASNPMMVLQGTLKLLFSFYPVQATIIIVCIVLAAILTSLPSVFMQQALEIIGRYWQAGD